jgi:hypothetical protein
MSYLSGWNEEGTANNLKNCDVGAELRKRKRRSAGRVRFNHRNNQRISSDHDDDKIVGGEY